MTAVAAGRGSFSGRRVLFVFDCLELGGAERQALALALHIKEAEGAEVLVLGLDEQRGEISRRCEAAGIASYGVRCELGGRMVLLKSLGRVAATLRQLRPDLILPYTSRPNIVCGLLWRLAGAKACIWNQRDEGRGLRGAPGCRLALRLCSFFVSNSEVGKSFIVDNYGLRSEKVKVVRNGVSLAAPAATRPQWRQLLGGEGTFVVCMVANLHEFKDHATLIRAWRMVLDRVPHKMQAALVLAGRFAGAQERLRQLVSQLQLEGSVMLLGEVSDVSGLLYASDLYVHSSNTEGVPNAVLEAMAAGLAVVATDIPGIREAVGTAGEAGLVAPKSPAELAGKMLMYMQDDALRAASGELLKQRVEREFATSAMVGSMVAIMERALNGTAGN